MDGAVSTPSSWFEYGERNTPAALTVERLRPHLASLGITRLARQTGLDRIGIPCFSAIRPAGLTLSVSQGKGRDDASAMASALMEAAEFTIAERSEVLSRLATADALRLAGESYYDAARLLPPDRPLPTGAPIRWLQGSSWPHNEPLWIPRDALTIGEDAADLPEVGRSTNGLASGNTTEEALFHAICELVERDATSLWSLLPDAARLATEFPIEAVDDAVIRAFGKQIGDADLELRLFDQTTNLGVPCVMAVISERPSDSTRLFDIAAGYGCHPTGTRAIGRAITEAAQTRITNIAGGRDDFLPAEYFEQADESIAFLEHPGPGEARAPAWLPPDTPLPQLLEQLAERIGPTAEIVWSELGGAPYGISVVRALSAVLEDRETNVNWSPGRRALEVLAL
ncbi:YcaO-like family protein [Devosia sp. LjRoot16]|uniref:YcaO-like family protein n=1 Tax=Devosia sp. LjRoot16 TaxID=3342271 RepID=UPI003ECE4EB1